MKKIILYLQEAYKELLYKVTWPSWKELQGSAILVMISSIFIVANTIRITIADRKITVEIMQLVGATRAYITAPFVAIGGLLGLTGSGVALGVLYIAVKYLSKSVMQLVFLNIYEILLFLGFGILVGIIGAFVTLPKYLK